MLNVSIVVNAVIISEIADRRTIARDLLEAMTEAIRGGHMLLPQWNDLVLAAPYLSVLSDLRHVPVPALSLVDKVQQLLLNITALMML